MRNYFLILSALVFLGACNSKKALQTSISENRMLDTLVVSAPKPDSLKTAAEYTLSAYNPSAAREHDLLHTKLDVRFDWENQYVLGEATLTLKPHFYPQRYVRLDAKNFDIHKVATSENGKTLSHEYDGTFLTIDLERAYTRDEQYDVYVAYTAKPADRSDMGGSSAITSDQGLFFINHDGSDPNKPMQIWTQGETEHNSRWFPTIDKPNERCTQELYITVQDKFKTLSNGLLVSSTPNRDGTRTDYWKMDLPHAPYLFMIGVGEFAVVQDKWNDIVVDYYVEPAYEKDARAIFAHTVEMLDFFSEKTGVAYPWPKYSQIVVRDYVSGAMENTSAVVFGEFVQRHADELIDDHNDKIVAHEMSHHWFGDLVTCESWANLTLNEGFANYSEYLWLEHKYGKDEADYHLLSELNGYIGESRQKMHPLIHFGYDDKEDMFDAHSYNKGGLILHMLRNHIGDDAFWAGIKKYLNDHQYSDVEADELRMAFEDMVGKDLNWFFDQWYFAAGHPELVIDYAYDEATQIQTVTIEQVQNPERQPAIFELPFAIDVYEGQTTPTRHEVRMTQRKQTFTFPVSRKPDLVNVDADKMLLCEKRDNKSEAAYIFQYHNAPLFLDRFEALIALKDKDSAKAKAVIKAALNDKFWGLRSMALDLTPTSSNLVPTYAKLVTDDPHSEVRATAVTLLSEVGDKKNLPTLTTALENDPSPIVQSAALASIVTLDKDAAIQYAQKLEDSESSDMLAAVGAIYADLGDASKMSFFEEKASKLDGYDAISFMGDYLYLALNNKDDQSGRAIRFLQDIALNAGQSPWRRFGATKALAELRDEYQTASIGSKDQERNRYTLKANMLTDIINTIKSQEQNPQLVQIYEQL